MKRLIYPGLFLALVGLLVIGCKQDTSKVDGAFQHTPETTHQQIQELRLQLVEAMEKKELQYIHDNMYYFKGLLQSLSVQLEGDKKKEVDAVLHDLERLAVAIDNSAGRGNQAATEANLQKLIDRLRELETHFQAAK